MRSGFPKSVEIAVCVNCLYLFALKESKACLGCFTGLQNLSLIAIIGLNGNPLDVVIFQHGVLHSTYGDVYQISVYYIDRNVLFSSAV